MLDEFCEQFGYARMPAIMLFGGKVERIGRFRGGGQYLLGGLAFGVAMAYTG
ncbi:MAG: hypothetical protein J5I99_07610 [Verrucomicrobia bacterium]|nr:hypothetical protein [Kiritimatiellia bacterium]MCO6401075.1 hypothetical protein [Verrucomicrobiota bacterium]